MNIYTILIEDKRFIMIIEPRRDFCRNITKSLQRQYRFLPRPYFTIVQLSERQRQYQIVGPGFLIAK